MKRLKPTEVEMRYLPPDEHEDLLLWRWLGPVMMVLAFWLASALIGVIVGVLIYVEL